MSAQALPSDIIHKVVRYGLYTHYDEMCDFKKGLKLLAVCHEWRNTAIPIVYRNAYISSGCYQLCSDGYYYLIPELAEKHSTIKIETNIDLIQSQKYVKLVRKLHVGLQYKALPFLEHAEIANVLSTASAVWPNVHTLDMVMFKGMHGSGYKDNGSHTSVISDIASRFTQLLPSVRHLVFHADSGNPISRILYGYIAGAYNNQLEKLFSRYPIDVPSDLVFTKLKHVVFNFVDITYYQPPSINPRVLESLEMVEIIGTTYWDSFCAGEQSNVIEFSNLTNLHLSQTHHDAPVDMNHNVYQIHFPCLRELTIESRATTLPWLYTAILPAAMKSLKIHVVDEVFTIPESFIFPVVENLELIISNEGGYNNPDILLTVNCILASTNKFSNVYLCLFDEGLIISPQDINCNNITRLRIDGPMTIPNLYAYLTKMTKLVHLQCIHLEINEDMEDAILPDPSQLPDPNDMPLNICTESLVIYFTSPEEIIDKMANIVNYLLLKLPNLTELSASEVPENGVLSFINAYKHNYPRLSAVRLRLDETNGERYVYTTDDDNCDCGASHGITFD